MAHDDKILQNPEDKAIRQFKWQELDGFASTLNTIHGLIINMKLLKELGNFNTDFWCEDIYLGLQLKYNDKIAFKKMYSKYNHFPNHNFIICGIR